MSSVTFNILVLMHTTSGVAMQDKGVDRALMGREYVF